MHTWSLLCISLAATLFSCAGPREAEPIRRDPAVTGTVYRGQLILGHEARSFTPCGGGQDSWVLDNTPDSELWKVHQELTSQPYQGIYVEVRGEMGPPPKEGFGAEHDSQLTIYELRRAALEGKGCEEDLRGFRFKARGNEPYWNLAIAGSGIVLSEMGSAPQRYPYSAPQTTAESWVYSLTIEGMAVPIEVTLHRQRCIDTMSGERFGYGAVVRLRDRELTGCAYEGEQ